MQKLIDELDTAYTFAIDNCDTSDSDGMETYKLMQQCIEQYRREYCGKIYSTLNKTTIREIGKGEIHLNLKGPILERLQKILDNEGNFLVYAYHENAQSGIGQRKDRKEGNKARRNSGTKSRQKRRNSG